MLASLPARKRDCPSSLCTLPVSFPFAQNTRYSTNFFRNHSFSADFFAYSCWPTIMDTRGGGPTKRRDRGAVHARLPALALHKCFARRLCAKQFCSKPREYRRFAAHNSGQHIHAQHPQCTFLSCHVTAGPDSAEAQVRGKLGLLRSVSISAVLSAKYGHVQTSNPPAPPSICQGVRTGGGGGVKQSCQVAAAVNKWPQGIEMCI